MFPKKFVLLLFLGGLLAGFGPGCASAPPASQPGSGTENPRGSESGGPTPGSAGAPDPTALPEGGAKPAFPIIGYFPSWQGEVEDVRFDRLTHVNYAFVLPTATGGLTAIDGAARLAALVRRGHAAGVKVSIAIGGWNDGDDSAFETVAQSPELRARFVEAVVDFVERHDLDGVDMDWEYPDPGASGTNFLALMQALAARLGPMGKLLTAAVIGDGATGGGVVPEVFPLVDFINIMAYDASTEDGWDHHSSYEYAEVCLRYWLSRGLPKHKAILGVPFYGKSPGTAYRELVARDPDAPNKDESGGVRYNGIDTIKKKTRLAAAMGGGIMIWEITEDTQDGTSLLAAINQAAGRQ